jgi:hypothetical protein
MFDLSGAHAAGYILRVTKDIVARNPRFRKSLGEVALTSNNQVMYKDVQVIVKDINATGTRLSPDNFMCTQTGRAILGKVTDKDGSFFEWVDEIDPTGVTPAPGVYMFCVTKVDEKTRKVEFTVETYKWFQGFFRSQGSRVEFAPGIDATTVTFLDPTTNIVPEVQAAQGYIYILSPVTTLQATSGSTVLIPLTDFWVDVPASSVILTPTIFGTQTANVPSSYINVALFDEDDFELRNGIDYTYLTDTQVQLSPWTQAGMTITARGTVKGDPSVPGTVVNAENTLNFQVSADESLAPDQVIVNTQAQDGVAIDVNANGTVTLATPLPPGGWCSYDVRVLVGQSKAEGYKMGSNLNLVPGLRIAMGDSVIEGDQCAIIVSPVITETYHVYGSKDNVTFSLDVKANDPSTASDLAELIKSNLLVHRRDAIEADGLTILEVSRSSTVTSRDQSGTAPSWVSTLGVTTLADWRVYKPLVNRIRDIDIVTNPYVSHRITPAQRYGVLGASGFLPDYR